MASERKRIVIVGSGFGGLGLAIKLLRQGERDFVVLERAHDVGGVWRDNSYPGCACDVKSNLYSLSFAPNPSWSRAFSPAAEIQRYLRDCAERFGVLPHVRFGHEVTRAMWQEQTGTWRVETTGSSFEADALVAATGGLSAPAVPELPGLASFAGVTMHSARWRHDVDLGGKRIAVVGTGASAIQFIPKIQPLAQKLIVFQRTPPWIVPRNDHAISPRTQALFARVPLLQHARREVIAALREVLLLWFRHRSLQSSAQRLALAHLKRSVRDPVLRKKLRPRYDFGCKRVLLSDDYYPAVAQPNVDVVTDAIREVKARSIVDAAGVEHEVDVLIFGTGFHVTTHPIAKTIHGRGGRSLADVWGPSMQAHVGTTVAGFPSFFMLAGPNTGTGHTSVIGIMESQMDHVLGALRHLDRAKGRGVVAVEPKPEAQAAFVRFVDEKMQGTVWTSGTCKSWYLDASGRNSTLWPLSAAAFHRRVSRFDPKEYVEVHAVERALAASAIEAHRDPEATHVDASQVSNAARAEVRHA